MVGTTLNALIGTGFGIRHVEEFAPTIAQISANPALAEEMERPMMLLISATRQTGTPVSPSLPAQ